MPVYVRRARRRLEAILALLARALVSGINARYELLRPGGIEFFYLLEQLSSIFTPEWVACGSVHMNEVRHNGRLLHLINVDHPFG